MRAAIDALSAHVAMLDEHGNILGVNAAWQRFGQRNGLQDRHSSVGRNYLHICEQASGPNAAEAHSVAQGIRDVISERLPSFALEYPCHSPTQKRWFSVQATRFFHQGVPRVMVAHQNITQLKHAYYELEENERRMRVVFDTVVDGILTMGEDGAIDSANPAACAMFGLSTGAMRGFPVSRLLAEPYRSQVDDYLHGHRQVRHARYIEVGHEMTGLRADGSTFPLYLALSRAYLGHRWLFTAVTRDLTPRVQMQQTRAERDRLSATLADERALAELKNRFMSMISHELRTPLSIIMLSADFLQHYGDRMDDAERQHCIHTVQTQVRHLETMMDDVSALSRGDDPAQFHAEVLDVVGFVQDVVANQRMLADGQANITYEADAAQLRALADAKLLRQAVSNLLSNAVKYSPAGGQVRVTLRHSDGCAEVVVADQGIGIPLDDQAKLFEPFHRAANVGTVQGTGLGLAVAKRAIELHGGSLTFASTPGMGSTFTLALPLDPPRTLRH